MISASIVSLPSQLAARAQALAERWLADRRSRPAGDPTRWRDARFLWPEIAKD